NTAYSTRLTSSMEVQLADCYKSLINQDKLEVELPPVQVQLGEVDCGVFAIAFAYDLAAGNDPSNVRYDQSKMREHLTNCLA
ncbi:polycystic kidney disease 1-like 2, partial [Paramuricea clavata]